MAYTIGMISLGCPKNQVDTEMMLAKLTAAGMEITDYFDGADAVIINTCGFVDDAVSESIENVLNMAELKKEGLIGKIIVVGCMAQRFKQEVLESIAQVDAIVGLGANGDIVDLVNRVMQDEKIAEFPPVANMPLEGERILTTPEYWAYLRIADGCDNNCAYCTIPSMRGAYRSRPLEQLQAEAQELAQSGVKELVLVAQDTTSYGLDIYGEYRLPELLRMLNEIEGLEWIRLLYCYIDRITDELLDTIDSCDKVLPYFDIPLQHCNDRILQAMNRRGSRAQIEETIARIREKLPDAVLRTTLITGLPGETLEEFEELAEFIGEVEFDHLGCFAFSPQEGTPAGEMENQVEDEEKSRRSDLLMQKQLDIVTKKNEENIDVVFRVLVEDYDAYSDSYRGRTYMDAPEIDANILFTGKGNYENGTFVDVTVINVKDYDLIGRARD